MLSLFKFWTFFDFLRLFLSSNAFSSIDDQNELDFNKSFLLGLLKPSKDCVYFCKNNFVESVVDYAMKLSIIEKEILNKNSSNENFSKDKNLSNKEEIIQNSDESNNSETTESISFSSLE